MDFSKKNKREYSLTENNHTNKFLILFNDDTHSFDYVITTLHETCNFSQIQAEQCALIAHTRGEYIIKSGTLDNLIYIKNILEQKGLGITIR